MPLPPASSSRPDISLAGRILANFADRLDAGQAYRRRPRPPGGPGHSPDANIIKLPTSAPRCPS
ncbi:NADP-dependent isocitrate dehydrogenase [Pseudomonas aeruginosa]|nr:NADP-dependent isocitrate dehydrogenase [Pseudomonas aeruginosa]